MRNFNVVIVDCNYMFRLQSNNHQDLYQKFKNKIILRVLVGTEQVAGICECGNEPSGSIKFGEFFD